jgi:type III restriction enzyme
MPALVQPTTAPEVTRRIQAHNKEWAPSPSEQGQLFSVPQLAVEMGGTLELFDPAILEEDFELNLDNYPADLSSFSIDEVTRRFSLDLDGRRITIAPLSAADQLVLPGSEVSVNGLIAWLNNKLRSDRLTYSQLDSWIRQAVMKLMEGGAKLDDLDHGKFLLHRKLGDLLKIADANGRKSAYQQALFSSKTPPDEFSFSFPKEYGQNWSFSGSYRFAKHYYPRPCELYSDGDEFECAVEIDRLEEVKFWVRNLAPPPATRSQTSFWLPAAGRKFYPDFVALLNDGRILVVEFKGRVDEKAAEDRDLGAIWASRSNGRAIFLMAFDRDKDGRTVREQLKAAIS